MTKRRTNVKTAASRPTIRCAIYTRKSSEEGLQQEFNSLDAQREAAEAYIASQKAEGWVCLTDRYDDGGFTGGNIDRPGLQRLLADIDAGKIDCVVVYKVDRLSRSLMDFARIVETFERHSVSFVSVTQHFNTTHSMGRLTLNILLSFAQFEREIIGERIRDKIAASRARGKWTGGTPILGYDVDRSNGGPKLVINPAEASQVCQIFELYLEMGSLLPVVAELERRDWRNKAWTTRGGKQRGGLPFDKCRLHNLLTNVLFVGKVRHKDEVYAGEHERIVHRNAGAGIRSGEVPAGFHHKAHEWHDACPGGQGARHTAEPQQARIRSRWVAGASVASHVLSYTQWLIWERPQGPSPTGNASRVNEGTVGHSGQSGGIGGWNRYGFENRATPSTTAHETHTLTPPIRLGRVKIEFGGIVESHGVQKVAGSKRSPMPGAIAHYVPH